MFGRRLFDSFLDILFTSILRSEDRAQKAGSWGLRKPGAQDAGGSGLNWPRGRANWETEQVLPGENVQRFGWLLCFKEWRGIMNLKYIRDLSLNIFKNFSSNTIANKTEYIKATTIIVTYTINK